MALSEPREQHYIWQHRISRHTVQGAEFLEIQALPFTSENDACSGKHP